MEKLIFLGTGNATVKNCYNTCFAILKKERYLLVDAGGGNQILKQLDQAKISLKDISCMVITHCHTDHILGAIWIYRMIATAIDNHTYDGDFHIYCHDKCVHTLKTMIELMIQNKLYRLLGQRIFIHEVQDLQTVTLLDMDVTFFDIHSTKEKQFGFYIQDKGVKLTCLGDEPCHESCLPYVQDAHYLLSEAFCLYRDRDLFHPYQKHHSTVKDASELAERMNVKNLILYHTEEKHLQQRKALYTSEAKNYYQGQIYVPDDLEVIEVKQ